MGGDRFRILAPVDFSEYSALGVLQAAELARRFGAELVVLNVVPTNQAEAMVWAPGYPWEQVVEDVGREARTFLEENVPQEVLDGLEVRILVSAGVPSLQIVRAADEERADLIVMATHGRTGIKHTFLGSVAEAVVRLARKPVWTVRKEAFAFEKP
ncbi:MAG: universal stress protein [Candidatus Tectomicrobia bacterium]|nr:universal stress protein [Candidatus Tectomicrobia bacterium]